MREQGGVLLGVVAGTEEYRSSLGLLGDELASSCTCPIGRDGSFCKHVVALGLAWLDASRPRGPSGEELREHLLGRTREELVDLLEDHPAAVVELAEHALSTLVWSWPASLDVLHGAAATYAEFLGPAGLARYRRLAEAEWFRVPPSGRARRVGTRTGASG